MMNWPTLAMLAIVTLAALLRCAPLSESLWIDELHTAWCAFAELAEVAPRAARGNQSPLFFWLEWVVIRLLGPAEWTLRLPSVVAGSLLPLAAYVVARRWASPMVGVIAAWLIALDPLAIFYSTEARPYAVVQLLSVIHVGLLVELIKRPQTWLRVAWIAAAAMMFHLHYTAGLLIVAEVIAYAITLAVSRPQVDYRWQSALIDLALVAALALPALPTLLEIFARRANWAEFVPQSELWEALVWWPSLAGALYWIAAIITRRTVPLPIYLLIGCALIPVLAAWFATAADLTRVFYPRYLVFVLPAGAILAAGCLELAPVSWAKALLAVLLAVVATLSVGQRIASDGEIIAPRNEDWRGAVTWLNEKLPQQPFPVLVVSGLIEAHEAPFSPGDQLLEEYLLLPVTSLYPLEIDPNELSPLAPVGEIQLDQTVEMLSIHRGGAWLMIRGSAQSAQRLAEFLGRKLSQQSAPGIPPRWKVETKWSGGHVHVLSVVAAQP